MSVLTTITPYWNREAVLRKWIFNVERAGIDDVMHIVFFVGDLIPNWLRSMQRNSKFVFVHVSDMPGNRSIGHYHNIGAKMATTEWIMKLDVDTFPHEGYFSNLLSILKEAQPREWFNGGMMYLNQMSSLLLDKPLTVERYFSFINNWKQHSALSYQYPAATNFICRREEYLTLGGSLPDFRGYGWEDYQQIFMLEKHWLQADPLPGPVNIQNVTQRCRDEISRRKALELFQRNKNLCLIHHWHPTNLDPFYRNARLMGANRRILLNYIIGK